MASLRPVKIAIGVVAAIVVVIVGTVAGIYVFSGSIIKRTVETLGPKMTQSEVKLDTVDLSLTSGEGRLTGLYVGNPKGFTTPAAMKLGEIAIKLDIATVTKDPILIREIVIRAPEIAYEYATSGDNIATLKKNVDSYVGPSSKLAGQKAGADEGGKKLIIETLRIQDGRITVAAMGQQTSAGLPTIQLKDIGKKSNGATASEVVDQVLTAIQQQVARVVQQQGLDKIGSTAKGALDSATKGITGGASGALESAPKDALKGIFGK